MSIKLSDLKEGMKIMVRGGFGSEAPREAVIDCLEPGGKNGMDIVNYVEVKSGEERWAYLDQVVRIIK